LRRSQSNNRRPLRQRRRLDAIRKRWPWLKHLFADGAYDRTRLMDKAAFLDFIIEIVRRIDHEPGFKALPRRWVVERTFGWMTRWRRLVRDYEQRLDVSEAMIHVAMGSLLLRRIAAECPHGGMRAHIGQKPRAKPMSVTSTSPRSD
jgi:transposase